MNTSLKILNIECYAFHGCLPTESVVGQRYSVDVELKGDFSQSVLNDSLETTADYCLVHDIVKNEMAIKSQLIEHVAGRIYNKLKDQFAMVFYLSVCVTKFNPPVNGCIEKVVFEISD